MRYADVILPLPLADRYTYSLPTDLEEVVRPGCRVIVHFGKKHYYTAIVCEVHTRKPAGDYPIKEIYALLDAVPVLRDPQLKFWEWIASYYLCKLGDVYKAALPTGLKLESETTVMYDDTFEADSPLRPAEQAVLDSFVGTLRLTIAELERRTGLRNVVPVVTSLMARGAVQVSEEMRKGFKPKLQSFVRLAEAYRSEEALQVALESCRRAKKQEQLLLFFLGESHLLDGETVDIPKKTLLEQSGFSATVLDGLLKRGILEVYERETGRLSLQKGGTASPLPLSEAQQAAYTAIQQAFQDHAVCLLHGVTSSGKTEIYIHFIQKILQQGQTVLYLLPEIALTTQITERLGRYFGDRLLVYHSKFSDNERVEVWNRLLTATEPYVVLGVRSSLFLPFRDLGLIIVDEEHETSYRQQDPAPRYHARNAAIILANMHGAKVLLGSATPSIDSYYNARSGKYGFVELKQRYSGHPLPAIIPVDIAELRRKKIMKETLFSPLLVEKISEALQTGGQVILFQNRRGFAPVIECRACGWTPRCVNCDVTLTYHKLHNELVCHYCGYKIQRPPYCPACKGTELRPIGYGTERIEEELAALFPNVQVARLDMDTARTRAACERILTEFSAGKFQILIGTQMISKGLDFGGVRVVGILNADSLMNIPDFRSFERAYQLMVQVSGRAGRREDPGVVVLQTSQPNHPLIRQVQTFAYAEMVHQQLVERRQFHYPPYYRLIELVLRSRDEQHLQQIATQYAQLLRSRLGDRVLGPVAPPVMRVQTFFIRKIMVKIEIAAAIRPVRDLLEQIEQAMSSYPGFKQISLHYEVDN